MLKDEKEDCYGIATDLGTTTIAIYLCNIAKGKVLSSLSRLFAKETLLY